MPVATLLGQRFSWHLPYVLVGVIAALTVVAIAIFLPHQPPSGEESMRAEMQALRRVQVWLALLIGVVGFGGMFAMYSFITPTMTELAGLDERYIPWVLAAYGIGMVAGMVLSGRVANRVGVLKGIIGALGLIAVLLALFGWAAQTLWLAVVMVFVLGLLPSIVVPLLQTRLMDVAHEGQSLAAALNHSTLNTANALGAWLGSMVLAAGWGYGAPSLVGAGLAVLGVGVAVLSAVLERRARRLGASPRGGLTVRRDERLNPWTERSLGGTGGHSRVGDEAVVGADGHLGRRARPLAATRPRRRRGGAVALDSVERGPASTVRRGPGHLAGPRASGRSRPSRAGRRRPARPARPTATAPSGARAGGRVGGGRAARACATAAPGGCSRRW